MISCGPNRLAPSRRLQTGNRPHLLRLAATAACFDIAPAHEPLPIWKYVIIVIIAVGTIYSLPNLYGEAPAVQVHQQKPL